MEELMQEDTLKQFLPATESWFRKTFGEPTKIQREAWPAIADGKHVLVSAPTGTGKTLSAFLVFIDQLLSLIHIFIIAAPLNWLLDKIPGINKIDFEIKDAKKYLGFFGEPTIMGLVLGCVIGVLAKYSVADIMALGVNMAAVMVLIPKMTSLFMEGLMPIS